MNFDELCVRVFAGFEAGEVHYYINECFRERGFGRDSVEQILKNYGFEFNLDDTDVYEKICEVSKGLFVELAPFEELRKKVYEGYRTGKVHHYFTNSFGHYYSKKTVISHLNRYGIPVDLDAQDAYEQILKLSIPLFLESKGLHLGKNTFKLDDGKYLVNDGGKYRPNLSLIFTEDRLLKAFDYAADTELQGSLNVSFSGNMGFKFGRFFKSKKGTNCFEEMDRDKAPHMLIKINWGGAFDSSRGFRSWPEGSLYRRVAKSNGGGAGNDYLVLPINFKQTLRFGDI